MNRIALVLSLWFGLLIPANAQMMATGIGEGGFGAASAAPTVAFANSSSTTSFPTASSMLTTGISVGAGAGANRFCIGIVGAADSINGTATAVTFEPSGFSTIPATFIQSNSAASGAAIIAWGACPSGTTFDVRVQYSANVFSTQDAAILIADSSLMSSTTPTNGVGNSNATTDTFTLDTSAKATGFIVTTASHTTAGGDTLTSLTGTETYTVDLQSFGHGQRFVGAHVNNISANVSNSLTYTFSGSAHNAAAAAAWR